MLTLIFSYLWINLLTGWMTKRKEIIAIQLMIKSIIRESATALYLFLFDLSNHSLYVQGSEEWLRTSQRKGQAVDASASSRSFIFLSPSRHRPYKWSRSNRGGRRGREKEHTLREQDLWAINSYERKREGTYLWPR